MRTGARGIADGWVYTAHPFGVPSVRLYVSARIRDDILPMVMADGLVVFAKRACPTCTLIEPVMRELAGKDDGFRVVSQDDPQFPTGVANVVDDRELDHSWLNRIEITPTLIRCVGGREVGRVEGWDRDGWRQLTGYTELGEGLPVFKPG